MTFCLSKGLSCPVGSVVVGTQEFVDRARKYRKMLGDGMRQAGIIAIMGLVALKDNWIKRLEEDHKNARRLAKGLKESSLPIKVQDPETNIIMVECPMTTEKLTDALADNGILTLSKGNFLRLVTHYGITEEDIDFSIGKITEVLKKFLP